MLGFQSETSESATRSEVRFVPPAGPSSRKRDKPQTARIRASSTVALQDDGGLTLFLSEPAAGNVGATCTLAFEVDDVEATHRELAARGVQFEKAPRKLFWGYGAELRDPDGYLIYLWDEESMRQKGGA